MPSEPKKKHSKARKRTRRASINLFVPNLVKCTNCSETIIPHQVCKYCGYYQDKKVTSKSKVEVVKT